MIQGGTAPFSVCGLALKVSHRPPGVHKNSGPGISKIKGPGYISNGIPRRPAACRSVGCMARPECAQQGQVFGTPGLDSKPREVSLTTSKKARILGSGHRHSPRKGLFASDDSQG